jgi:hypothetical protein
MTTTQRATLDNDWRSYTRFVGVCATVATAEGCITYPFDLVKTRQQTSPLSSDMMHRSTLRYLKQVVRTDGVRSLYRGFGWSLIGGLPSELSFYLSYTVLKDGMMQSRFGKEHQEAVFLSAGALADTLSLILWVPADVISQRLQVQGVGVAYAGPVHAVRPFPDAPAAPRPVLSGWQLAREIVRSEGPSGMWRGLGATIAVHTPASAMWWLSYEKGKQWIGEALGRSNDDSVLVQSAAGACAGAVSASITTPLDLLKTRLQCASSHRPIFAHLAEVLRDEGGVRGLFRGFVPRVIASAPRSVISLVGYELALKHARCEQWDVR